MKKLSTILNHFLPAHCVLCHNITKTTRSLCSACEKDLPSSTHACYCCGQNLNSQYLQAEYCGACLATTPPFYRTIALWEYQSPVDKLITDLKFHECLVNAKIAGELLAEKISTHYTKDQLPECIIPIPLHATRLRERGYNQAVEIARPLAKKFKLPILKNNCQRSRPTQAQSSLAASEREQNVKNAFQLVKKITAKHVAIVDDVMTTGHTLREFCKVLRTANVERMDVWCCARTS